MKSKKSFFLCMTLITSAALSAQVSPHVISFFIRPFPSAPTQAIKQALKNQGPATDQPFLRTMPKFPFTQSGMYAIHAGIVTYSQPTGQIVFERKTVETKVTVLITNALTPLHISPFSQKTLYGFIINPGAAAQEYLFERLQDPETETYFWQVTAQKVDPDRRISYDTLVLYADPNTVIVPLGPSATKESENLVLPDFYVTEQYNSALNALRFLKIRHFFAPEAFTYAFLPNGFQQTLSNER